MAKNAAPNPIVVVDYGAGNLRSAARAVEWAVDAAGLSVPVAITSDPEVVASAARIVLPGQGAFGACIAGLRAIDGMVEALEGRVLRGGAPFLGICVGMQLMATTGLEHGEHAGLNWIPGRVVPIDTGAQDLPIPHMGWNEVEATPAGAAHPVLHGLRPREHFYFVHSFVVECKEGAHVLARTDYGAELVCAVGRDNMMGVQFHPEKSQRAGLALLDNFVRWRP